jgi:hypothetical protein
MRLYGQRKACCAALGKMMMVFIQMRAQKVASHQALNDGGQPA